MKNNMGKLTIMPEDKWAKEEKLLHERIIAMAKGSSSKGIKSLATDIKLDEDPAVQTKCKLTRRIFSESLDMFEDGTMTYEEFCEDFYKSCKEIAKTKAIKIDFEDEEEEKESDK